MFSLRLGVLSCHFIPEMGGCEVFAYNLLKCLSDFPGYRVDLFLPSRACRAFRALKSQERFRLHALPGAILAHAQVARQVLPVLHKFYGIQVWQALGAYPAGYSLTKIPRSAPVVMRSYGEDIQKSRSLSYGARLDHRCEQRIRETLTRTDGLVALTKTVRDCYLELGADAKKIVVISNGTNLGLFDGERPAIPDDLKIPPGCLRILTVGRHHPKKGFDIIPKVAVELRARGLDFIWLVVGRGVSKLRRECDSLGISDRIRLKEQVGNKVGAPLDFPPRELLALYRNADMFVFPSLLETFGMVLIEAMAAGAPVITTDAPGCRDVVEDGRNGLVFPVGSVRSLADQIHRLAMTPDLKEELAKAGRQFVRNLGWADIAKRYDDLYRSLLSTTRRHSTVATVDRRLADDEVRT